METETNQEIVQEGDIWVKIPLMRKCQPDKNSSGRSSPTCKVRKACSVFRKCDRGQRGWAVREECPSWGGRRSLSLPGLEPTLQAWGFSDCAGKPSGVLGKITETVLQTKELAEPLCQALF